MTTLFSTTRFQLGKLNARVHLPAASKIAVRVAYVFAQWDERRRTRYDLSTLDDHMLNDIGITRRGAHGECKKPFWRP